MTAERTAFRSIASLLTSHDEAVTAKARAMWNAANAKTGRGSGQEMPGDVQGTAVAAGCLMLAQINAHGASDVVQKDYQTGASVNERSFNTMISILRSVLDIQGQSTATTPKKGSGRKRKAQDSLPEVQVTPTKSVTKTASTSSRPKQIITVEIPAPRSSLRQRGNGSSAVSDLISPSISPSKRVRIEHDVDEHTNRVRSTRSTPTKHATATTESPLRKSVGSAGKSGTATDRPETRRTPVKSQSEHVDAFEAAMSASTPLKAANKQQTVSTPVKKIHTVGRETPTQSAVRLDDSEEADEVYEEPYEPYQDDLLFEWRDKKRVDALRNETEQWRQSMLEMLMV